MGEFVFYKVFDQAEFRLLDNCNEIWSMGFRLIKFSPDVSVNARQDIITTVGAVEPALDMLKGCQIPSLITKLIEAKQSFFCINR